MIKSRVRDMVVHFRVFKNMAVTICQSTDLVPLRGENGFEPCQKNKIQFISSSIKADIWRRISYRTSLGVSN